MGVRSDIRREILAQHLELRNLLPEVEALAGRFERAAEDDRETGLALRETALALYEKFGAHLDREQELLEPELQRAGAHGERLARRLAHEHREQRELLEYLLRRLRQHPYPTLLVARQLVDFAGFLRVEMDHEEQTLLSPALLGN